jgi:hypothetical protein
MRGMAGGIRIPLQPYRVIEAMYVAIVVARAELEDILVTPSYDNGTHVSSTCM